jgi:ElaB/YqjD/DUF883 family membrane-anchored ribosome-binding protein
MNESHDPEKENQSSKEQLKAAAEDLKAAAEDLKATAAGKIEEMRETAGEKTKEWRKVAEEKAKEASRAVEHAWYSAISEGRDWVTQGEAYVRKNPAQAMLIALGIGIVVGIGLRKR